MKTITKLKSNQALDSLLVVIMLFFAFVMFISITLHVSPSSLISLIDDFATHHFILAVSITFFCALLSIKYYYNYTSNDTKFKFLKRNEKSVDNSNRGLASAYKEKLSSDYGALRTRSNDKTTSGSTFGNNLGAFFVSIVVFVLFVFFVAVALHISPSHLIEVIENFASHHSILVAGVTFFSLLLTLRFYYKKYNGTDKRLFVRRKFVSGSKARLKRIKMIKNEVVLDYQNLTSNPINVKFVDSLDFKEMDILTNDELKIKRYDDLQFAMKLGNLYKEKVKIYFIDINSNKCVYTSVWYVSNSHVALKHGSLIPIRSIYDVKF